MNARGKWREGRTDGRFTFNRQVEVKRKCNTGKVCFQDCFFFSSWNDLEIIRRLLFREPDGVTTLLFFNVCFFFTPEGGHRLGNLHTLTHWGGKVHTLAQTLSQEHISNHVLMSLFILAEHISSHGDMSKLFWLENSKERGGWGRFSLWNKTRHTHKVPRRRKRGQKLLIKQADFKFTLQISLQECTTSIFQTRF